MTEPGTKSSSPLSSAQQTELLRYRVAIGLAVLITGGVLLFAVLRRAPDPGPPPARTLLVDSFTGLEKPLREDLFPSFSRRWEKEQGERRGGSGDVLVAYEHQAVDLAGEVVMPTSTLLAEHMAVPLRQPGGGRPSAAALALVDFLASSDAQERFEAAGLLRSDRPLPTSPRARSSARGPRRSPSAGSEDLGSGLALGPGRLRHR